jgi:hypothetical protein
MQENNNKTSIKEEILKIKRKEHPNHRKYIGKKTFDHHQALLDLVMKLSDEENERFVNPNDFIKKEQLDKFLAEIKPKDIIGIEEQLIILTKKTDNGIIGDDFYGKKTDIFIPIKNIDIALCMNCCEILYRDEKPYGVSEEVNIKIRTFEKPKE